MRLVVRRRSYLIAVLVAASLITGMATGLGLFYRLAYIFALVVAASFAWNWLSLRSMTVSVERGTRRVTAGDTVEEHITVQNTSSLPRPTIEIEDLSELPGFATGNAMGMLPSAAVKWTPTGVARRRGVYTMGPVVARNTDPFGSLPQGAHLPLHRFVGRLPQGTQPSGLPGSAGQPVGREFPEAAHP